MSRDGEVKVEGHSVGRLDGFRFVPDAVRRHRGAQDLLAAANRVLRGEIAARASELAAAPDGEFALDRRARCCGAAARSGGSIAGESALEPRVESFAGDFSRPLRESVRRRLAAFWRHGAAPPSGPAGAARHAELDGAARGLVFQLCEALGMLPARAVAAQCAALSGDDRKLLARLGVRLGTETVYFDGC